MNNNRSNTRMIAIADDFVLNEEWSKEIDKASSPHLEMLKRFIESLNKNRVVDCDIKTNNVMIGSISLARAIKGIVIQVVPSGDDDISLAIYYDENGLSRGVYENMKLVYSNLVTGIRNNAIDKNYDAQNIGGVLALSKYDFSDSDNFERDDTQASLSFEEIASHLPYNFVNERRA